VNTVGEYVMPPLIHAYRLIRPDAEILLEVANRRAVLDLVESSQTDVGIGGRPPGRHIVGRPFLENELIVVARRQPDDLAAATWLLREEGSGTRATVEGFLSERRIEPRETLTLGSNGAVKQGVLLGLGVTLISTHAVARELRAGDLVRVSVPGTPLSRPWYTLVARGRAPRRAVGEFLEFLHAPTAAQLIDQAL
jgi:DNA-binding transcriptional LysR family regulator